MFLSYDDLCRAKIQAVQSLRLDTVPGRLQRVDHGLRRGSAREARHVKLLATSLGVTHRIVRWSGAKPESGLPAAARDARYRLLARTARAHGASHILTAHTRDDQAETVLMRISRGSGIAGLTYALKAAAHGTVAIVTKKERAASSTNYAQGGIAAVVSKEDSFELHVRDTLEAGAGLCHEDVVRTIVEEGPARIHELVQLGMHFSEVEHGAQRFDVLWGVLAVAFLVFFRLKLVKLGFPEADKRRGHIKLGSHFPDGIVLFLDFSFLIRHSFFAICKAASPLKLRQVLLITLKMCYFCLY